MPKEKRILVCANPDLNYIDGSSVWAQTIALVIAETGLASVDFLAKSTPVRDELFLPLKSHPAIRIVDGTQLGSGEGALQRMNAQSMVQAALFLDRSHEYDIVIVRGLEIARRLREYPNLLSRSWVYLTDLPQDHMKIEAGERDEIAHIALGCQRILCQSEGFVRLWKSLAPNLEDSRFLLYSPVIPDVSGPAMPIAKRASLAVYAGKFCRDWMTLEMAEVWREIHIRHPQAVLRMMGDKIHNDSPGYQSRMKRALQETPGLDWLGAVSRQAVQEQLRKARLGLSWRSENLNETLEYSTKILEYGGAGCATILNRNPLHEELLGEDYPLFANTHQQFVNVLEVGLVDDGLTQAAASRLADLAQNHTFSRRVQQFERWLRLTPVPGQKTSSKQSRKLRILVAGHDLKFFDPIRARLEQSGRFEFLIDHWDGHNKHDEGRSHELLTHADVIVCEWCLGNVKWYSHHRKPNQRLLARFHLQERDLPYLAESNWENIDQVIYVSEFIRREGQKSFGFPKEKTTVIANYVDPDRFHARKKTGDARFTLGMIGSAPSRKRLDRAVDLLEMLLQIDSRYCLRVKGRHPLEYEWLVKRPDELDYYHNIFRRINGNSLLSQRVIFDPAGNDVNEWLSMVGYILSPSDFESFHMSIGEGILAGCQPIVWDWDGAREIWGEQNVIDHLSDAKRMILESFEPPGRLPDHMKPERIISEWLGLLDWPVESLTPP